MKNVKILIFDLDDTLVVEEGSAVAALEATAELLSSYGIDKRKFAVTVREKARELWKSMPTYPYCRDIGISSWEGLWARFTGSGSQTGNGFVDGNNPRLNPHLLQLRSLKDQYHFNAWNNALLCYDIQNKALAKEMALQFNQERRKRHFQFPESAQVLEKLQHKYRMGLITNGTPDLQWEKIRGSQVEHYFEKIIISGEVNVRKPQKEIFEHMFAFFQADKSRYLMIGNSLKSDIGGAVNAGIKSVWINRDNQLNDYGFKPDFEVRDLTQLFEFL